MFQKQIAINPQPQPGFVLPQVCLSDAFAQFNDTSKITSGSITNWIWNFGDGVKQTFIAPPFQHTYTTTGIFSVSLTVVDAK